MTAPNLSTRFQDVGNAYFACSQNNKLKHEYKDSNRKRIDHFSCDSKLNIKIDILAKEAKVVLKHKLIHDKPIDITTLPEIKQEIIDNLNMNPKPKWTDYQFEEVSNEFSFVDPSFKPDLQYENKEYYVVCPSNLHKNIIDLVRKHFNMHSKIPINSNETIPFSKTNIMIEAYWKVLKHTYLYQYNHPQLDYLIWVICTHILLDQIIRLQQILLGRTVLLWFEEFKKE
ncbi:13726_t:CDS:2 [Cetraspora pellucida]|uniref:13726_t:CDS:1 n=1 Tax=Cetraspora pellucida TaxID=1433469 RepID=A0A9N9GNB9_9GLOM|nr:13726_t:CDS:2 [Cetraspora pellucida]